MLSKHVKSPCCGAKTRRFGKRRRQCCACKKTWSIRPKKRGRPRHRTPADWMKKVFFRGFSLTQLHGAKANVDLPAYRYRFRQLLQRILSRPHEPKIPDGPLVLLADGVWFQFNRKHWVLYLAALKACSSKTAIFLQPQLHPGRESASNWQRWYSPKANWRQHPGGTVRFNILRYANYGRREVPCEYRAPGRACEAEMRHETDQVNCKRIPSLR